MKTKLKLSNGQKLIIDYNIITYEINKVLNSNLSSMEKYKNFELMSSIIEKYYNLLYNDYIKAQNIVDDFCQKYDVDNTLNVFILFKSFWLYINALNMSKNITIILNISAFILLLRTIILIKDKDLLEIEKKSSSFDEFSKTDLYQIATKFTDKTPKELMKPFHKIKHNKRVLRYEIYHKYYKTQRSA